MAYNIVLLHYTCPPVVGGVEEVIGQHAWLLNRYDHNIKVLAGEGRRFSDSCDVEINPLLGSRDRRILSAHVVCLEGKPEKMETVIREIHKYLVRSLKGFDILIAHNTLTMPFNLPLTTALHRMGQDGLMPIISWNHDSPYFYPSYPEYLDLLPWNILRRVHAGIHYIAVSESRKEMFGKLYGAPQRITVVPNGIDPVRFFRLDPYTVRLIREQNLFASEFLMLQPSRLHPRKNMELSIRVTKALHDLGVKARLLITGARDPHEPKCIEYYDNLCGLSRELGVENDVLIMGEYGFESGERLSVDQIVIRDLYLIADILFLPSLQEGFGIPLLESGMLKLPIVCSNIPPFLEIGGDEVCIFDLKDRPEKIARKIMDFVGKAKPQKMFRRVIRNYAWDSIYHEKFLPLLDRVAGLGQIEESQKTAP